MAEKDKVEFTLSHESLDNIRYIRLAKKANYYEYSLAQKQVAGKPAKNCREFYSFGFYDSLSCIQVKGNITYKEHFLITYPYEKTAETLKAEQFFCLLPIEGDYSRYSNQPSEHKNPFGEFPDEPLPFIGLILVSLRLNTSNNDFKKSLAKFVEDIGKQIIEKNAELNNNETSYYGETYYSLNCADLCLAVRTNSLSFINNISQLVRSIAKKNKDEVNTTVIFGTATNAVKQLGTDTLAALNKDVYFIIRSNRQCPTAVKHTYTENKLPSYGVNGVGKYVTKLTFDEYMKILSKVIDYRLHSTESKTTNDETLLYVKSICHEREWFDCDSSEPQDDKLHNTAHTWIESIFDEIKSVEDAACNENEIFSYEKGTYIYKDMFTRKFAFIKDLMFTYADLIYQKTNESGYIFLIQMHTALRGIERQIEEIKKNMDNDQRLYKMIDNLLSVIHDVAVDLNGYNKQFQYLNQDSVNFPSYEIQSKVNSEKYMSAYCSFLHKFAALYYNEKSKEENSVQSFPMAMVDFSQKKIITKIFFSDVYKEKTKGENEKDRNIFSVHFPNSDYFANVWDSIPLLMHEISHTHHYGKTEDRNEALFYCTRIFFAEKIASRMLSVINDGTIMNTSSILTEYLRNIISEAIEILSKESISEDIKNYGFLELRDKCLDFYNAILDRNDDVRGITYSQKRELISQIKSDIELLLRQCNFAENFSNIIDESFADMNETYYFMAALFGKLFDDKDVFFDYNKMLETMLKKYKTQNKEPEKGTLALAIYLISDKFTINDDSLQNGINKIHQEIQNNGEDYIYYALSLLSIQICSNIWAKYVSNENQISKKCPKELYPKFYVDNIKSYVDRISGQYKKLRSECSFNDQAKFKSMLSEYYDSYVAANNLCLFLRNFLDEIPSSPKREKRKQSFINLIHNNLKENIKNIEDNENNKDCDVLIFASSNRGQLMRLGIFEENGKIIEDVFNKMVYGLGEDFVSASFNDRVKLFQEVYADCGMCNAMNFNAFGYCMFTMTIHNNSGDPSASNSASNFLADRVMAIMQIFFFDDERNEKQKSFSQFCAKLFDKDMICGICETFKLKIDTCLEQFQPDYNNITKQTLSDWNTNMVGALLAKLEVLSENETDYFDRTMAKTYLSTLNSLINLFIEEDIFKQLHSDIFNGYFIKLSAIMNNSACMKTVRNNNCVKSISNFYNMDLEKCRYKSRNKFEAYCTLYKNGFAEQCNFIFDNYCDYRTAYGKLHQDLTNHPDEDISNWVNIIENYYKGSDGNDSDSKQ